MNVEVCIASIGLVHSTEAKKTSLRPHEMILQLGPHDLSILLIGPPLWEDETYGRNACNSAHDANACFGLSPPAGDPETQIPTTFCFVGRTSVNCSPPFSPA